MEDNKLCQNPEDRIALGKPMATEGKKSETPKQD